MVPWKDYINNILTKDLVQVILKLSQELKYCGLFNLRQVEDTERVIVDEPGYLKNLTELLPKVEKRTIANYM